MNYQVAILRLEPVYSNKKISYWRSRRSSVTVIGVDMKDAQRKAYKRAVQRLCYGGRVRIGSVYLAGKRINQPAQWEFDDRGSDD